MSTILQIVYDFNGHTYYQPNRGYDICSYYKEVQVPTLANYLLVGDRACDVSVHCVDVDDRPSTRMIWPNKGELISGSAVMQHMLAINGNNNLSARDVDIYFKSKENALEFCELNKLKCNKDSEFNQMCLYAHDESYPSTPINLIYGVEYDSPQDLISRFDIRAISAAIDPNEHKLYVIEWAISDAVNLAVVFNPLPRRVSVARLVKYINKGFCISAEQRLFFAELLRTDIYSAELELSTGY